MPMISMRNLTSSFLPLMSLVFLPLQAVAVPGDLDASFSGDGLVTTTFGMPGSGHINSVIQQKDGKLIVAGYGYNRSGPSGFLLIRYNMDGTLDTGFSKDGKVFTDINTGSDKAYAVIEQADGKLVVAGYNDGISQDSNLNIVYDDPDALMARYNKDGSLDTTFDGDGKVITDFGDTSDLIFSMTQQADGKLVVAGAYNDGTAVDILLIRYNADGSLDTSFDGDGRVTTDLGVANECAYSVIQQADGKLVVAGYSDSNALKDIALVRYNSDGSLDTSFDGDGKLTTDFDAAYDNAYSVIQQADGKLVVAGTGCDSALIFGCDIALVRYNSDGSLDTSFDGDGKLTTDIDTANNIAKSVIQQGDGKLVVTGSTRVLGTPPGIGPATDTFVLARYNSDGSLDSDFNGDGILTLNLNEGNENSTAIIQQKDGKLVMAGYTSSADYPNSGLKAVLARFETDQIDTDNDGLVDGVDTDNDDDGIPNTWEIFYGLDPFNDFDSITDGDSDGISNLYEFIGGTNPALADTDSDATNDNLDNCPTDANADQLDTDGDGVGDVCDAFPNDASESVDTDSDGTGDNSDNCLAISNLDQADSDGNGFGDACDNYTKIGTSANDNLGAAIATADMNADGYDDLIVGIPGKNISSKKIDAGQINIISGSDGSILKTFNGTKANQRFGSAIAVVDDQNGDGVQDLIVGSPLYDSSALKTNTGKVELYSGADGVLLQLIVQGKKAGDQLGASVAVADIDNDGEPNLIVGAPSRDFTGLKNAGQVTVYSGINSAVLYQRNGTQAGERFGASVAVDEDQFQLLVGSPFCDVDNGTLLANAGRVTVFDSADGVSAALFTLDGTTAENSFGSSLTSFSSDLDGDTFNDWAVGSSKADVSAMVDAGKVEIFSGFNATPIATIDGATAGDNFGASLSAGDLNGDGENDIAIGAPKFDTPTIDAGRVEVMSGMMF